MKARWNKTYALLPSYFWRISLNIYRCIVRERTCRKNIDDHAAHNISWCFFSEVYWSFVLGIRPQPHRRAEMRKMCSCHDDIMIHWFTVYPKKYAHGFVVLCSVVVIQSFIMNSHEVFIHIHQGCFAGTGAIVRLPQCRRSKPDGYGKISQCITTANHSKAKPCAYFLGYTVSITNQSVFSVKTITTKQHLQKPMKHNFSNEENITISFRISLHRLLRKSVKWVYDD